MRLQKITFCDFLHAMKLNDYIEKVGPEVAARQFGVTPRAIQAWRLRQREPRPDQARTIVRVTGGEVTFEGIYARPEPQAAEA